MIGRKLQNYKILSLLGEGGMGSVYKAFDVKLERYAALKILNLNSTHNSTFIERFKREARNQAKLMHPNIVSVFGFVEEKDVLGIAMEYIEGDTLESIIRNNGRIEFKYALELMEQILTGIEFAHQQGFIHRDLKPSNIILDLSGNAKIMAFGISKSIEELKSITQHNARPGTLLYMSPEQLSGNTITINSDLYALGITFYEMLSGVHPFHSQTIYEIIESHVNKIPARINSIIPSIPIEADDLILKALHKAPENNYNNASEFKAGIKNLKQIQTYNDDYGFQSSQNYKAVDSETGKKISSGFQKISNILLFILFVGLAVIVFNVVKSIINEKNNKEELSSLSYTQDYSKNPNYLQSTDWDHIKSSTNNNLNTICFADDYNGFIAGDSGLILQSVDGGLSWKKISNKYKNDFYSIYINDDKTFLGGSSGFLGYLNAKNELIKIVTNTSASLFKILFINSNTGFIVGSDGLVLRTNDGGVSWKKIESGVTKNLYSISFSDSKNGVIVGWSGTILKTIDAGLSWKKHSVNFSNYLKDVLFVNEFLGLIVGGEGMVLRTEDGGADWNEIDLDSDAGLFKIHFNNSGEAIILTNRGEIFLSNDSGKNWIKKYIGQPVILNDIQQLNSGNFIVVANNGNIFTSKINPK
jgi:serine/threonine-protein kinase